MQHSQSSVFKATILAAMVLRQLQSWRDAGKIALVNVSDNSTDELIVQLTSIYAKLISASLKQSHVEKVFYVPVILKGDYTGTTPTSHERQNRAQQEGCICVVDCHFNSSSDASAIGGEVHYKAGSLESQQFADSMWAEIASLGLPAHGAPVQSTAQAQRSAFIERYSMPSILIEPLFISNPIQANWLHSDLNQSNIKRLAKAIASAIRGSFPYGGKIGLSAGHAFKFSSPNDPGSQCAAGDTETSHTLTLVALIEEELKGT